MRTERQNDRVATCRSTLPASMNYDEKSEVALHYAHTHTHARHSTPGQRYLDAVGFISSVQCCEAKKERMEVIIIILAPKDIPKDGRPNFLVRGHFKLDHWKTNFTAHPGHWHSGMGSGTGRPKICNERFHSLHRSGIGDVTSSRRCLAGDLLTDPANVMRP